MARSQKKHVRIVSAPGDFGELRQLPTTDAEGTGNGKAEGSRVLSEQGQRRAPKSKALNDSTPVSTEY